ncbi:hypothetical protein EJ08DRAFT_337428 [Tothia fuscella]|uniref:Uncharacterized protein n=1 Tax=Tothia fuscella TaxID=1048955 RepID=A0A9P4U3V6_9PEZI|nr:hypothetical protein EJ08DRAFT_337428 [Tothia fuscella]
MTRSRIQPRPPNSLSSSSLYFIERRFPPSYNPPSCYRRYNPYAISAAKETYASMVVTVFPGSSRKPPPGTQIASQSYCAHPVSRQSHRRLLPQ